MLYVGLETGANNSLCSRFGEELEPEEMESIRSRGLDIEQEIPC